MKNLTTYETKKLLKEFRIYIDGGTTSWRECMAIIGTFDDRNNNVRRIQSEFNLKLNYTQKQIIKSLID